MAENSPRNEERWADLVGREAGVTVHKVRITPRELTHDLDDLITTQAQPFGSTSIYTQNRVFRRAREQGVIVMLDGQGADELLAGYGGYSVQQFRSVLRRQGVSAAMRFMRQFRGGSGISWFGCSLQASYHYLPGLRRRAANAFATARMPSWIAWKWFAERGVRAYTPPGQETEESLLLCLREEVRCRRLPCLLRYEDRNSMAYGLESPVPFLNARSADFVLRLPEEFFRGPDGSSKWIFRKAMRCIVPDAVLNLSRRPL